MKPAFSAGKPEATLLELMAGQIDPAADALWASVESTSSAQGVDDKQPQTEEEWAAVRHNANALVKAADALLTPGLRVAAEGQQTEDSHLPGVLKAPEIQKKIDTDAAAFAKRALALQEAAKAALAAIDARDTSALFDAGGKLDHACEQCHTQFWYPDAWRPTPPKPVAAVSGP